MARKKVKDDSPASGVGVGDRVTIIRGIYQDERGYVTELHCPWEGIWTVVITDEDNNPAFEDYFTTCNLRVGW